MRQKWLLGWLLFATAVLLWVVMQANAQETIPYQVYLARIGRYRTQIQNPTSCEVFDRIAGELEGITAVQMPDGSIMTVEHAGADEALRQSCDVGTADRYLAGLCPGSVCAPGPAQLTQPADQPALPSLEDFSQNSENTSPINPETGMTSPSADNNQPQNQAGETGNPANAESAAQPQPGGGEAASEAPASGGENPGVNPQEDSAEGAAESSDSSSADSPGGESAPADDSETGSLEGGSETPAEGAPADDTGAGGEQPGGENAANTAGESGSSGENGNSGETGAESTTGELPSGEAGAAPAAAEATQQNPAAAPTEPAPPELAPEATLPTPLPRRTLLIISIVTIILVLLITILIILYLRSRKKEEEDILKKPSRSQPSRAVRKELDEGRQKVQQGEYREAVRKLFLAALITLDEQGAIQYDKTLTNMELLRGAVKRPSLIQPLTPVINTFERVWYGYEPLQTPEYESLVIQIHKLREKASDEYQQVMSNED